MRVQTAWISHEGAQLNHYITKWFESFSVKAGGSSLYNMGTTSLYSVNVYERYNRNEEKDKSAVALKHRFQPVYDDLMTVPDLKARHHLNCAHYIEMLSHNTGGTPEGDARHATQLQAAADAKSG